jgi:tetratricopeptide (TPR) repeat protein
MARTYPEGYLNDYSEIDGAVARCYFDWGLYLQSQKSYSEALEKYQLARTSDAEEAIPKCYLEWVSQLVAAKEYDEAIQKYSIIIEKYPLTVWASLEKANVLSDLPADVLFTWATKFQQEKSYDSAMILYETLLLYYPESQYASQAEKASIDTQIAIIAEGIHGVLPPLPPPTPQQLEGKAELTIINDTPYTLTVLLSGPTTKSIIIQASPGSHEYWLGPFSGPPDDAMRDGITLEPGVYRMVAKVDETGVTPYYGEITLNGDSQYDDWFYIRTQLG